MPAGLPATRGAAAIGALGLDQGFRCKAVLAACRGIMLASRAACRLATRLTGGRCCICIGNAALYGKLLHMAINPRISVTLDPQTADTLRRLAVVQRKSTSAIAREVLSDFEPSLRRIADLGECFELASIEQKQAITEAMDRLDQDLAGPLMDAVSTAKQTLSAVDSLVDVAGGSGIVRLIERGER